jgi:arylsulfatase A-like enzyme
MRKSRPLLLLLLACTASALAGAARPNVIVIFTDDQGTIDAGCFGARDLETPAIDALAARGVRFTQFYAAAPVCSPSRAGLLTGRYPWLAGMGGNAAAPPPENVDDLTTIKGEPNTFAQQTTLAEVFQAAGYATAHIGKWHLNYGPGSKPLDQGFDTSFGHMDGCIDNYSHVFYWAGPNRHDLWENNKRVHHPGRFFPDLMVEKATAFMQAHKDKPFLLYFAINLPHYPYQGEPKWLERYRKLPYPRNLYAAFISTMDERIGALTKAVDRLGLTENTIVVFQSDQGHSTEARAHFGGGDNGIYRGAKGSVFEGGLRVPAIISWPGRLPRGEARGQMAHGCDWMPTLAELCGVKLPDGGRKLDGKSLVKVIRSADAESPHEVLHFRLGGQWAVRRGPWKLMHQPRANADGPPLGKDDKKWFLANLAENPGETKNYAEAHPDIVKHLQGLKR